MRQSICFYSVALSLSLALSMPPLAVASDTIAVKDAWSRATPPGAGNSATYCTVLNSGELARKIVAAHSQAADKVQIHTVIDDNGLVKMRQVQQIEIPAGGVTELKPGGFHIMMLGVKEPLREGEAIDVEIEFANGERLVFVSPIKKMAGAKAMDHSKMEHD